MDGKGRGKDGNTNGCHFHEHWVPSTRRFPHTVAIIELNRPKELLMCHSTGASHSQSASECPLKVIFEIPTFYVFSLAVTALACPAGLTNGIMGLGVAEELVSGERAENRGSDWTPVWATGFCPHSPGCRETSGGTHPSHGRLDTSSM